MKFSTQENIAAPIDKVWHAVTDAELFEAMASRKGATIERTGSSGPLSPGVGWTASFDFRGMRRTLQMDVVNVKAPIAYDITSKISGVDGVTSLQLEKISEDRTRLMLSIDLTPASVSGRVLIQTLRLAKTTLNKRFKKRVARFAKDIAARQDQA